MSNKTITLGSSNFTIPELAFRQNRIVTPLVMKLQPQLANLQKEGRLEQLTTEQLDDLAEVVYQGVVKGLPHLTKDNFLDLNFKPLDLLIAFPIVAEQAGFKKVESTGEAHGAASTAPALPQTGTNTSTT